MFPRPTDLIALKEKRIVKYICLYIEYFMYQSQCNIKWSYISLSDDNKFTENVEAINHLVFRFNFFSIQIVSFLCQYVNNLLFVVKLIISI